MSGVVAENECQVCGSPVCDDVAQENERLAAFARWVERIDPAVVTRQERIEIQQQARTALSNQQEEG